MRYVFNVCDRTGHTPIEFSEADKAAAAATFAQLTGPKSAGGKGMFAYANKGGGEQAHLRAFDDTVEETTFHEQLQGG